MGASVKSFELDLATAHSRLSTKWKNRKWKWADFVEKCREVKRTGETVGEYMRMSRDEQSAVKDVGGFVGGYLSDGKRSSRSVRYRTCATLDIDYGTPDVWDDFALCHDCAAVLYSTHKHTPEKPRYRLVIPFSRPLSPAEYEPVCRRITQSVGIDLFDATTYQTSRLFYWPSAPKDGEFVFRRQDGEPLDVDKVLRSYVNPADASEWPMGSREGELRDQRAREAGDPTEKPGLIGAFCRCYGIEEAIAKFLPDAYEPTAQEGRYTYKEGSVAGGLVCYQGVFAYSNHETDPASRRLCNAFDLVRIHKFGELDGDRDAPDADVTRLPSYAKMTEFASKDEGVRKQLARERKESAAADFDGLAEEGEEEDPDWTAKLDYDKKGNLRPSYKNLRAIMANDAKFRNIRYDLFSQCDVPVSEERNGFLGTHGADQIDDSSYAKMCAYLSDRYGIDLAMTTMIDRLLKPTAPERSFNAVQEFILREQWDGTPRVETLLIDYLGAEDTPMVRAVTRKWMAGAVGRAFDTDPDTGEGIKFDYCLVLLGEQGTGKSTFAEILAGRWRGAISLAEDRKGQCETLQRSWIVEIPELKGMRAADMDSVKDLITRRSDNFREAYAKKWCKNPRHCVMIGSTNNEYFLKDTTGNRRFWVVKVTGGRGVARWCKELRGNVGQIWAEAYKIYKDGEPLMLEDAMEAAMRAKVESHNEIMGDPLMDALREWLDTPLPADWETYEPSKKIAYYRDYDSLNPVGSVTRAEVAIHEIVTQCGYPGLPKYGPQKIGAMLRALGWIKVDGQRRLSGYKGADGKNIKATFFIREIEEDETDVL